MVSGKWIERRKQTSRVFYVQDLINGIEYSLTFTNLYLYLKQVINTDYLVFHYSAISAVFLLSMTISSLILGRIFDRHRNIRVMLIFANFMMIIGNAFYTIPTSPWLLFMGRLIAGVGSCMRSLLSAELARSYTEQEVLTQFSRLGMAFGLGFIAGPGVNFAFVKADFQFLGVHIMFANGAGLMLIFVLFIQLGLVFLFVSNLSKEFDLKEENRALLKLSEKNEEKEEREELILTDSNQPQSFPLLFDDSQVEEEEESKAEEAFSEISTENSEYSIKTFLKLMKSIDMVLIMVMSTFFQHCYCVYDIWQPMAAVQYLDWGIFEINLVNFGYGGFSIFSFFVYMLISPSKRTTAYITIVCILSNVVLFSVFFTWKWYNRNNSINIFLSVLFVVSFSVAMIMDDVFLPSVLASLVPSHSQAFAESVRLSFSRLGSMLSLLFAASMFNYLEPICVTYIGIVFIILAFFIWRLNRLVPS